MPPTGGSFLKMLTKRKALCDCSRAPPDAALEPFPLQYMRSPSDTVSPRGPSSDQSMSARLQQCQHALQLLGFPSVDAFVLEYYTARFGPGSRRSGVEQREGLNTLDRLAMLLQNESPRGDAMDTGGLQRDIEKSARELCIAELRDIDHKLYDPDKAEHQFPQIYKLLYDMLTVVGCRPDLVDATVRSSIQGLLSTSSKLS
ncbi:uncharacterized protein N7498_008667 [Penicillium cinerascens]|uniref:Uncharacterized protein n=1 Tax=Penicillium cinerascens TaxID=70096 RepID=A0A9W9JF54_9EURO|nr:uncharacterized protein N7498_008667 [Penicillium cinerascens]KAJ5195229.1 hypothetical protein N7498_008667 [Penicillium cinerascens]